jgi:hypothetical protein
MSKCLVEDCNKSSRKRGWCSTHYERWRQHGDVNAYFPNAKNKQPCSVEGCDRLQMSNGFCQLHHGRWFRHGDTDSLIPNYGVKRRLHEQGYIMIWDGKKYVMEHVLLAEQALGRKLPPGAVVHHMNEDPADNLTPLNLVICPDQAYHLLIHRLMKAAKVGTTNE